MFRRGFRFCFVLILIAAAPISARADFVLEWNDIMLTTLAGQSPANETRLAAITQIAVFEAVNAVSRDYEPYLGSIKAPRGASAEAAAVAAAHAVLTHYVPGRAAELDLARASSLESIPDGPSKDEGIVVGQDAAAAMIELRADDGSEPAESYRPDSSRPGAWQMTVGCPTTGGVFLHWQNVTPFGIESNRQFRVGPPPALKSRRYADSYNEVRKVGGTDSAKRPQDRADVARFYSVVLAIRTWNPVAHQAAAAQGHSLSENARTLALLNMAMSDALVAVFDSKYRKPFWRPETAIPAGDSDGNRATAGDPQFKPFIPTPCHPSYPSAHASAGYAARVVLERIYGRKNHLILVSSPAVPDVTLEYHSFEEITADIDDARVFGGIHFRFDQQAGARQGCRIGKYIYRHKLRPAYGRDGADLFDRICPY